MPEDFVKFGLIPEFIGRVPVTVALDLLDEEALIDILTKPKNALIKQYKKLFELDSIDLDIEEDAVRTIAKLAWIENRSKRLKSYYGISYDGLNV